MHAGRVQSFEEGVDAATVLFRRRGTTEIKTVRVGRFINCSGPARPGPGPGCGADYDRIGHPLTRKLLERGTTRPDVLRLGLDVTSNCALLSRDGAISRCLFAVEPVTKGAFWEMAAVPDIRRRCETMAYHLAGLAKPGRLVPETIPSRPPALAG